MIALVDYGAGNLRSVANTLSELGAPYEVVRDGAGARRARKIILPGVGHFGQMMRSLDVLGVREPLLERIRAGVPFLGICLGLQALFEGSEEAPELRGFGLYPGKVRRFANLAGDVRVPHMGWDQIEAQSDSRPSKLLANTVSPLYVYFAHSYYAPVVPATAATCTYSLPYTAVLEDQNVFGVQFHPEKSGKAGLCVMKRFVDLA
jgi:imidazole glycerol phosphate synthase glutamine amidotransferase subunit